MAAWSFLTKHGLAMVFIANHPEARLRDIASALEVTERTAFGLMVDLVEAGYVVKQREGRRNRYQLQEHLPLRSPVGQDRTVGEVLDLLVGSDGRPT